MLNNTNIEIVERMKLLGTIINDKLTWSDNCDEIVSKVNKRMLLLKRMLHFGASIEEMVHLWILYCRSALEQSAVLWSNSLTQENKDDLERTQKCFAKLVLRDKYKDNEYGYENALLILNLQTLEQRRNELSLNFAKNCIKNDVSSDLFPINNTDHPMKTRYHEMFKVLKANTDRLQKSSVIQMQHLLNSDHKAKVKEKELTYY